MWCGTGTLTHIRLACAMQMNHETNGNERGTGAQANKKSHIIQKANQSAQNQMQKLVKRWKYSINFSQKVPDSKLIILPHFFSLSPSSRMSVFGMKYCHPFHNRSNDKQTSKMDYRMISLCIVCDCTLSYPDFFWCG